MSTFTIENSQISVSVGTTGAELLSLRAPDGAEQIWRGDADIWGRRGPVIFPVLGGWPDGYYLHNGEKYVMDKNGFARSMEFTPVEVSDTSAKFVLISNENTLKQYPIDFLLCVNYYIVDRELHILLSARNDSNADMPAGLGLHPGFVWERKKKTSRLVFSDTETLQAFHPDGVRYPFLEHGKEFELKEDSFKNGAITMENLKSRYLELHRPDSAWGLRIRCEGFSYFTLWSMDREDADFVCLEPSTNANTDGNKLTDRRGIIMVPPGETLTREIVIELFR